MAAAAVSLACPLRRSSRLAHGLRRIKCPRPHPDLEDHDSSSSDPENELTPRALRALKRQRLALDPDGLPLAPRARPRRRRKENTRPSTPPPPHKRTLAPDAQPHPPPPTPPSDSCHSQPGTATSTAASLTSIPEPISDPAVLSRPELSIPLPPISQDPSSPDPSPLTPLTPLTPSPESSPSLPGHDRQTLPPSPPQDSLPAPVQLDPLPMPPPDPTPQPSPTEQFAPPPSLDPALDTLIPFDGLHPQFDPELSVQLPPSPTQPQLQGLELQDQFHSFPQHQLYVPPHPVFVRDREINIWKLACQERVDCLLRRYGSDYIKALVESQACAVSSEAPSSTPQTKFRLYTPASYTYSLSSWGSTSGTRNAFSVDDQGDDVDPSWPMDDADWVDADVDMEDEDEDDYEDEDDAAEVDGEATLEAVEGLVIADTATMQVDDTSTSSDGRLATKPLEAPPPPRPPSPSPDPPLRPSTPLPHPFLPPPPLTPPTLPLLSSLHVPLLSEPPRAFMGRGTPPDRRRLIEWSGPGRFATNGMGPPLYLSPVPQRHPSPEVGIVPMSVEPTIQPATSQSPHGEWTSFLYSMLEGDGVGVDASVGGAGHASEPSWYELGLASVPSVVSEPTLELPHARTSAGEQSVDEVNSSSTLRFALG